MGYVDSKEKISSRLLISIFVIIFIRKEIQ